MNVDVSVAPVKFGCGCKIKMFESLAIGIPTVGFHRIFGAIPLPLRQSFEAPDTTAEYVESFRRLLSMDHRKRLSTNSRAFIESFASQEVLLRQLAQILGV
jgi:hypothetical protein